MKFRELTEFLFLCKEARFQTMGQVWEYMKKNHLTAKELYRILDKILFLNFN